MRLDKKIKSRTPQKLQNSNEEKRFKFAMTNKSHRIKPGGTDKKGNKPDETNKRKLGHRSLHWLNPRF